MSTFARAIGGLFGNRDTRLGEETVRAQKRQRQDAENDRADREREDQAVTAAFRNRRIGRRLLANSRTGRTGTRSTIGADA